MPTNKRIVQAAPPLTVGVIPDTGEEVVYPTPTEQRRSGGSGVSRATVKKLIKQNACCPPIIGGWGQLLNDLLPPVLIPAPGTDRLILLVPLIVPGGIVSFNISVGKMQDPNATTAKVELLPSPFNAGTFGALDSVEYIANANPVFDVLQVNFDTEGAEVSIGDLVLTNTCGCCATVPVEFVASP